MIKPLFDVFREAMLHNPKGSRKEARDRFIEQVKADPAYLDILAVDYFDRMAATYTVREEPLGYSFGKTDVAASRGERISAALVNRSSAKPETVTVALPKQALEEARKKREAAAERAEAAFVDLKAKIRDVILLDLTLPNGKALRHATGAECKKAGGFYAEVAKAIKPTQVVDRHLSEADLQNIRARFYQANAEFAGDYHD